MGRSPDIRQKRDRRRHTSAGVCGSSGELASPYLGRQDGQQDVAIYAAPSAVGFDLSPDQNDEGMLFGT